MEKKNNKAICRAVLEALEERQLMSAVSLDAGVLSIAGDPHAANELIVNLRHNGTEVRVHANDLIRTFNAWDVKSIRITGGDNNDFISINKHIDIPAHVDSGAGVDIVRGGAVDDTLIAADGRSTLRGRGGDDTIRIDASVAMTHSLTESPAPSTDLVAPATQTVTIQSVSSVLESQGGQSPVPFTMVPQAPFIYPVTGGIGASHDTITLPPSSSPSVVQPKIVLMDEAQMVGAAVHVHALESNFNGENPTDLKFDWNFGETDATPFNDLSGFNAAHIYDHAGTYLITLRITDEAGHVAVANTKVTINPDDRQVIYISNDGNDANSGLSQDQAVKSLSRAREMLGDNTELLFKRGDTFAMDSALNLPYSNVLVGSYGQGARPRINWTANGGTMIAMSPSSRNVVVQDLSFDTPSRAGTKDENGLPFAITAAGRNITVRGNEFLNVDYAVQGNGVPIGLMVQDNTAPLTTGLRGYLVWGEGSDYVIVGNTVANSTRQHIVRMTRMTRATLADNDLTNLDRRSIDSGDYAKGAICIHDDNYVYVSHNTITDGGIGTGPLSDPGLAGQITPDGKINKDLRSTNVVIEQNILNQTQINAGSGSENIMIRDNVVNTDGGIGFVVSGYNVEYQRGVQSTRFLHNTVINSGRGGQFMMVDGKADGLVVDNNLYVAPNLVTGDNLTAEIYVKGADLSSFKEIANNVWSTPQSTNYARGGYFYIWEYWSDPDGYQTPEEWAANPQVHNDQFQNVTLQDGYQVAVNGVSAGSRLQNAA